MRNQGSTSERYEVEGAISALDCLDQATDTLTGLADALHLKGTGSPERDECCLMLSEVAYSLVDAIEGVTRWLSAVKGATQDTPEGQTGA